MVESLEEAGAELLTFYRFPESQWKGLRTTNIVERVIEEFRRREREALMPRSRRFYSRTRNLPVIVPPPAPTR